MYALVLIILLCLVFTACGGSNEDGTPPAYQQGAYQPQANITAQSDSVDAVTANDTLISMVITLESSVNDASTATVLQSRFTHLGIDGVIVESVANTSQITVSIPYGAITADGTPVLYHFFTLPLATRWMTQVGYITIQDSEGTVLATGVDIASVDYISDIEHRFASISREIQFTNPDMATQIQDNASDGGAITVWADGEMIAILSIEDGVVFILSPDMTEVAIIYAVSLIQSDMLPAPLHIISVAQPLEGVVEVFDPPPAATEPPTVAPEDFPEQANDFWNYLLTLPDDTNVPDYVRRNYRANRALLKSMYEGDNNTSFTIADAQTTEAGMVIDGTLNMIAQITALFPIADALAQEAWLDEYWVTIQGAGLPALGFDTTGIFIYVNGRVEPVCPGRVFIAVIHNLYHGQPANTGIPNSRMRME